MPAPKIRFYLHSVTKLDGYRTIYLSVAVGERRPVRLATGYTAHPDHFNSQAPHLLPGTVGSRALNRKLDYLRLTVTKTCQRLHDAGQLHNATLEPLLRQEVALLAGRPAKPVPAAEPDFTLPLAQQPLRAVWAAWRADSATSPTAYPTYRSPQYLDWMTRFDPEATPATADAQWVRRYVHFLVRDTSLVNTTIDRHLHLLRLLVAYAGLPTKDLPGIASPRGTKCFLTWAELQQVHAWQPPASQPSLARQKDVFVARCLCGLSHAQTEALQRAHIRVGDTGNYLDLAQLDAKPGRQFPVGVLLQKILDKYQHWPTGKALPVVSRQQTQALVKQLLREAGIDAPYVRVRYKGSTKQEVTMPKWQAASLNTACHTYEALLARGQVGSVATPSQPD